jgi:hypothetical protein
MDTGMKIEWPRMADLIPEGSCGTAEIEHFTVSPKEAGLLALRAALNGRPSSMVTPGRHARLLVNGEIMMSDTRRERDSNVHLVELARGHLLLGGLGLGMVVWPLLAKKPELHSITILEINPDVISLVGRHLPGSSRIEIIQADVFKWRPSKRMPKFNSIYFDIWPDICLSNVAESIKLRERARQWASSHAWIGDWDAEVRRLDMSGRRRRA